MNTSIDLDGTRYAVWIDFADYIAGDTVSQAGQTILRALVAASANAKRLAGQTLIDTYNDIWVDDDHPPLSLAQFESALTLKRIEILDTPDDATLYFDDGDLFGGHAIAVSCRGVTPQTARLEG